MMIVNPLAHLAHPLQTLVVVLNYRTAGLTIDCLTSLLPEVAHHPEMHVVVADNASGDDSLPRIEAAIAAHGWDWVTLLPLDRNGGFAFGNNVPLRWALELPHPPDYFLLLNPDTIVRSGAVALLVEFLQTHPEVGIVGSRLEDPDGTPQYSAFRFHSLWGEVESTLRLGPISRLLHQYRVPLAPIADQPHLVDWVSGASFMIRRQVLEHVGFMDEHYFMYYEETDFCLIAQQAGWPCWYVPQSRVVHLVGQSSGVNDGNPVKRRLPGYLWESRRRYFVKHCGVAQTLLIDLLWVISLLLWRLSRVVRRLPNPDPPRYLLDFLDHSLLKVSFDNVKGRLLSGLGSWFSCWFGRGEGAS
jgi:N-acetylglucosaminyl-diphospho-decaprenol L-rhamnosyltransferase